MGNNSSSQHLRPEAVSDLENATEFTAEEIKEYYKRFMGKTTHGRMTLTQDEFITAYTQLFPKGDARTFAEHVFRLYDRDGSGRIGKQVYQVIWLCVDIMISVAAVKFRNCQTGVRGL